MEWIFVLSSLALILVWFLYTERRRRHLQTTKKAKVISPKAPNAPTPEGCIFCGGGPSSKQHIIPDWLQNVIPRTTDGRHTLETHHNYDDVNKKYNTTKFSAYKQGHPGTQKKRKVCIPCNGGWMSKVEDTAKPLLTKLILNETVSLTLAQQALIAKWAVMTTIMAEYVNPENRATPKGDREYFYNRELPPEGWRVWIGKMPPGGLSYDYKHTSLVVYDFTHQGNVNSSTLKFNTQLSVFIFQSLLILTVRKPTDAIDPVFHGELGNAMIRVYPSDYSKVNWHSYRYLPKDAKNAVIDYMKNKYFYIHRHNE